MYKEAGNYIDFADNIVAKAIKTGADEAEVYLETGEKFSLKVKDRDVESLEQSVLKGLGLRIYKDGKLSFGYTSDFGGDSIDNLINDLLTIASYSDEDVCNGLPEKEITLSSDIDLNLYDENIEKLTTAEKIDMVRRMEDAAKSYDKRVFKFRSCGFNNWAGLTVLVNSRGIKLTKKDSYGTLVCLPVAEDGDDKHMSFWFSAKRHLKDLKSPEEVGKTAAERAVKLLGGKPVKTQVVPVVFSPLQAAGFCEDLGKALGGQMIFRKNSFFVDKLDKAVASEFVTLIDDGLIPSALGSTPFDGEGVLTSSKKLIDKGILKSYLFDVYYGRKMKGRSTGNATRGYNELPVVGTTNLYIEKGRESPEEIIKSVDCGLYLTSTMGSGLDYTTGDYSVGAEGFWIEKGQITHPVSQITISANILDILKNVSSVGNDLDMMDTTFAPTIKVSQMTVSGK